MATAINWFELPASDFDRAVDFYEKVLARPIRKEIFAGLPNGVILTENDGVGGAIVKGIGDPVAGGALVYLNAGTPDRLKAMVERIEPNGGKLQQGITSIGPQGFIAVFTDCEGNRVGLHAPLN